MEEMAKMIAIAKRFGGTGGGTSTVVVLEETTLTRDETDDGNSYYLYTPFNIRLEAGKTYNVNYNGTGYDCPAVTLVTGENGETAVVLGNISIAGLEGGNADAPFIMIEFAPDVAGENGPFANVVDTSGATSVTISITQKASGGSGGASSGGGGIFFVNATPADVGDDGKMYLSIDKNFNEIKSAVNSGSLPYLKLNMGEGIALVPCISSASVVMQFGLIMNGETLIVECFSAESDYGEVCFMTVSS
jgi:hypothetical protein